MVSLQAASIETLGTPVIEQRWQIRDPPIHKRGLTLSKGFPNNIAEEEFEPFKGLCLKALSWTYELGFSIITTILIRALKPWNGE